MHATRWPRQSGGTTVASVQYPSSHRWILRLASLGYNALRLAGVTTLARRLAPNGVVLCYHNVAVASTNGSLDTLGLHMPVSTFERQMRWLMKHYAVVPLEEFVGRALRGVSLRGVAAVTFDDGYTGVFENAWPVLVDLSIPATVFLVADAHGREEGFWWDDPNVLRAYSPERHQQWLTALKGDRSTIIQTVGSARSSWRPPSWCRPAPWRMIAAATGSGAGRLQLGVHSATHRSLPALSSGDLDRELVASRDVIRRHTGLNPVFFAYPYGLWDERTRRAVHSAGYRAAFILAADRRTRKRDPWALPRLIVPAGITDAAFQAWTAGLSLRRRPDL
jgi:peptidoglycan/xylan/chitin deacetylase (PgdA/CDA1 family)